MIAFALSGGGNRGTLQVGALQVLLEKGVRPDILVGTSAGAINAAFLAADPTPAGAYRLGELWQQVTKEQVYPGGPLRVIWHLLTHRDSLYPNENLRAFVEAQMPAGVRFFHQLAIPLYIVATDLRNGEPYIFGDNPEEPIVDAIMASTAIPPFLPPWSYRGRLLVDGGVAANLPIGVAVEKGATEIYALDIQGDKPPEKRRWTVLEIATWSINALMHQQWDRDLTICAVHPEVTLHHLPLRTERRLAFSDFSHSAELIAEGRQVAEVYLATHGLPQVRKKKGRILRWKRGLRLLSLRIARRWRTTLAKLRQRKNTFSG